MGRLKDTIIKEGKMILIVDHAKNGDLGEFVSSKNFSQAGCPQKVSNQRLAKHLLFQMALALEYLHINHVAHRDIKPSNIVLGADGLFQLIDFGVSRILEGQPYSKESDIWSLGAVIYWLCMGEDIRGSADDDLASLIQNNREG